MDRGRQLDLTSGGSASSDSPGKSAPGSPAQASAGEGNPFLGVHFACCDVYSRVYPNKDRTVYVGHCPRCARRVQFRVGPGGTEARFFTAE